MTDSTYPCPPKPWRRRMRLIPVRRLSQNIRVNSRNSRIIMPRLSGGERLSPFKIQFCVCGTAISGRMEVFSAEGKSAGTG
jgi:hypothetical protein